MHAGTGGGRRTAAGFFWEQMGRSLGEAAHDVYGIIMGEGRGGEGEGCEVIFSVFGGVGDKECDFYKVPVDEGEDGDAADGDALVFAGVFVAAGWGAEELCIGFGDQGEIGHECVAGVARGVAGDEGVVQDVVCGLGGCRLVADPHACEEFVLFFRGEGIGEDSLVPHFFIGAFPAGGIAEVIGADIAVGTRLSRFGRRTGHCQA